MPDMEGMERVFREGSHASGASALHMILEDLGSQLPTPLCERCGKTMNRHRGKGRPIVTRFSPVTTERVYCYCLLL